MGFLSDRAAMQDSRLSSEGWRPLMVHMRGTARPSRGPSRRRALGLVFIVLVTLATALLFAGVARADVTLNVVKWNQNDYSKYNTQNGYNAFCAATSIAMVANYYGGSYNDVISSINQLISCQLVQTTGYVGDLGSDNGYVLSKDLGGTAHWDKYVASPSLASIESYLNAGNLVVGKQNQTASHLSHFYVIVGYQGSTLIINDPWTGETYANPYSLDGADFYSGTPAAHTLGYTLQNGGFESWSGPDCLDWSFGSQTAGASAGQRTDLVHSGGSSIFETNPSADPATCSDITQAVMAQPGKVYTLGAWVVSDRNASAVHLHLQFLDAAGNQISAPWTSGDQWGVNPSGWSHMSVTGIAPANAVRVVVYLRLCGGTYLGPGGGSISGEAVFDDITLDIYNQTLQNTSFESWSGPDCLDWSFGSQTAGASAGQRTDLVHSGGSSIFETNPSADPATCSDITQAVMAQPGKVYTLGAWVVSDRNASAVHLHLQFLDAAGNQISAPWTSGDQWGVNPSGWSHMSVTGIAPANAVRVVVYLRLCGGTYLGPGGGSISGEAVFDDITLACVTDITPPTTKVSGADDLWHNQPVTLTFSATDNPGGSGMSGGSACTEYKVDSGAWTTGITVTIAAPVSHANDGIHTVDYRSCDAAGNWEKAKNVTVKIDTTGPTTSARAASGRKAHAIVLHYEVSDALSPTATAVRLVLCNSGGKAVKSWSWASRTIATWYIVRWTPKAKGSYRYYVYGKDLAGNTQASVGHAKIVVR